MDFFKEHQKLTGIYYTPFLFAQTALTLLEKKLGTAWWSSGEFRIWDMAAGIGNLIYHLHQDAYQFCYLSTLNQDDVAFCEKKFPFATCFQYDYLNDDINNVFADNSTNWKLPTKLKSDLDDKSIKWIILVNPPFATSQTAGNKSLRKTGVSDTQVRKKMHSQNLGEVSRELFSQFIFRIKKEFENRTAYLGLFSKIKYLNATNDQKFRDSIFQFTFIDGFFFSSSNFDGTSKQIQFPVGFLLWDMNCLQKLESQKITLEILNPQAAKIGIKTIVVENKSKFLNKWIERPVARNIFPPVGSAITFKFDNKDLRNRVADNFLASLMCAGNNFQCQNQTAIFSAPAVSAGAISVTPDNFGKAMVVHAVRRIPKATWINDRDQFLKPNRNLADEFIVDCVLWNLFSPSNQTAALKNIEYQQQVYQIKNNLFPFLLSDIVSWKFTDELIFNSTFSDKNRYVSDWLTSKILSSESDTVLDVGKKIYQFYFENLYLINLQKYKIETWDAGWWQIRNALRDANLADELLKKLQIVHNKLRDKLLPQIYDYGFIID